MRASPRGLVVLLALAALTSCGPSSGKQPSARMDVDWTQPAAYLEVHLGDSDLLLGLDGAGRLSSHFDRASAAERFAGTDDPRLNNFSGAARALAAGADSGR